MFLSPIPTGRVERGCGLFANHLQMYVRKTFTKAKNLYYAQNTHPMSSQFHLSKWKTYFSQFIDKFFKIEEVEYLIHYVKFNM